MEKDKSCSIQSLSIHQLIQLQNQGWEITETKMLSTQHGEHKINDMPAPDMSQQVIYDMSSGSDDSKLKQIYLFDNQINSVVFYVVLYYSRLLSNRIIFKTKQPAFISI